MKLNNGCKQMVLNIKYFDERFLISFAIVAISILCISISLFSPLGGFFVGLILLVLGIGINFPIRLILSLYTIINYAFVGASKYYTYTFGDDFGYIYLPLYNYLNNGGSVFFSEFSGGVEFLFPLYLKICTFIFGPLSDSGVLVVISLLNLLLFYFWLEIYGFREISSNFKSLGIAIAILFFSYTVYLQIMRQSTASVILLFALSTWFNKKYILSFIFLIISSLFHISSIIFFPIILFLFSGSIKNRNIFIIILGSSIGLFPIVVDLILNYSLLGSASYKAEFYKQALELGDNNSFIDVLLSAKILILALICLIIFSNKKIYFIKNFIIYCLLFVVIISSLSQLPYRFMNILYLTSGYFVFLAMLKYIKPMRVIVIFFICFKMVTMMNSDNYIELIRENPHETNYHGLWYSYPWADDKPLYYLK